MIFASRATPVERCSVRTYPSPSGPVTFQMSRQKSVSANLPCVLLPCQEHTAREITEWRCLQRTYASPPFHAPRTLRRSASTRHPAPRSVASSVAEFCSARPGNPNAPPAACLPHRSLVGRAPSPLEGRPRVRGVYEPARTPGMESRAPRPSAHSPHARVTRHWPPTPRVGAADCVSSPLAESGHLWALRAARSAERITAPSLEGTRGLDQWRHITGSRARGHLTAPTRPIIHDLPGRHRVKRLNIVARSSPGPPRRASRVLHDRSCSVYRDHHGHRHAASTAQAPSHHVPRHTRRESIHGGR